MALLPSTVDPSLATNRKTDARVLEAGFGDGYSQRAGDGINTVMDTWNVSWNCLNATDYNELNDFFEDNQGYISFEWTPVGETVEKKFICRQWSTNHIGNSKYVLSATFNEVWDL